MIIFTQLRKVQNYFVNKIQNFDLARFKQRRSQVSLAGGGADRIPGGGDKPQYL